MTLLHKISDTLNNAVRKTLKDRPALRAAAEARFNKAAWESDLATIKEVIGIYPQAVNWQSNDGLSALHCAACARRDDIAQYLLDMKADMTLQDKLGNTALHYAAQSLTTDVTVVLIAAQAPLEQRNKDGETPLSYALGKSSADNVVLLVDAGADVGAVDNNGDTPATRAAVHGSDDVREAFDNALTARTNKINAHQQAALAQKAAFIAAAISAATDGIAKPIRVRKPLQLK